MGNFATCQLCDPHSVPSIGHFEPRRRPLDLAVLGRGHTHVSYDPEPHTASPVHHIEDGPNPLSIESVDHDYTNSISRSSFPEITHIGEHSPNQTDPTRGDVVPGNVETIIEPKSPPMSGDSSRRGGNNSLYPFAIASDVENNDIAMASLGLDVAHEHERVCSVHPPNSIEAAVPTAPPLGSCDRRSCISPQDARYEGAVVGAWNPVPCSQPPNGTGTCRQGGYEHSQGSVPHNAYAAYHEPLTGGETATMDPVEAKLKAKEWQWQLKMEVKQLEREIKKIEAGEAKLQKKMVAQAQSGNVQQVQEFARAIVQSRHTVKRLETTKATLDAARMQLATSIATISVKHSMRVSVDLMREMNSLASSRDIGAAMESMRHEMARCVETDNQMEEVFHYGEDDEESAIEVQRVIDELELEKLGLLASVPPGNPATALTTVTPQVGQLVGHNNTHSAVN